MRVFLDIGSHVGESVWEVVKPKYGFDRIVCFEPASSCLPELERLRTDDPRIEICPFGLSDENKTMEMHNAGSLSGSVFAQEGPVETIRLVDAADWFESNLAADDFVVAKTNCEGSEVDIVNRLLDRGQLERVVTFLVTFDIRDYREFRHKEGELRRRLKQSGLTNYCFSDDVMIGTTHEKRLAHWLSLFGVDRPELGADEVKRRYAASFRDYSRRSGRRQRLEQAVKDRISYAAFPEPLKAMLRAVKRAAGLSRERDVAS